MTEGQRRVVGWMAMSAISLAFWACVFAIAHGQQDYRRDARAVVYFKSVEQVRGICGMLIGHPHDACANGNEMIVPNPCLYSGDAYAWLLCHELGHVNGMPRELGE